MKESAERSTRARVAYQIEYARLFNWRSAHGQETPESSKIRREGTQGVDEKSVEDEDHEAIGQTRRQADGKAYGTPCGSAPQCRAPRGGTPHTRPSKRAAHECAATRAGNWNDERAGLARHEQGADASARRRSATVVARGQRARGKGPFPYPFPLTPSPCLRSTGDPSSLNFAPSNSRSTSP